MWVLSVLGAERVKCLSLELGYNNSMADFPAQIDDVPIQTPQVQHQQVTQNLSHQLTALYGEKHNTMPVTSETPVEIKSNEDLIDRVIYNRPGTEPSKSFLKKVMARMKKKHPDADVTLQV